MNELVERYGVIYDKEGLLEEIESIVKSIAEKAERASKAAGCPADEQMLFLIGVILLYGNTRKCLRDFQRVSIGHGDKDWAEFIEREIRGVDSELGSPL